jgi:hypothetical protein
MATAKKTSATKSAKSALVPAVGSAYVFVKYEKAPKDPILTDGEFVEVYAEETTKGGRLAYSVKAIDPTGDPANPRVEQVYATEMRAASEEEQGEIATLIAQMSGEDAGEDLDALAEAADAADGPAQERLTLLCAEAGIDSMQYGTWVEVVAALRELQGDEEEPLDYDALAEAADGGDPEAEAKLTELCNASGIDTNSKPTWAELAADLAANDPAAGEDEVDLPATAAAADAGDADSTAYLTELCTANGVDVNSAPTWVELIAANFAEAEAEAAPEPEPEPEPAPAPAAKKAAAAKVPAAPAAAKKSALPTPKGTPAAKKAAAPAAKKAAGGSKLNITANMQKLLGECGNDVLAAMQMVEEKANLDKLELGGLIALGFSTKAHLKEVEPDVFPEGHEQEGQPNPNAGKPVYEDSAKGYYAWVAANLDTEERTARDYARCYTTFVHSLKYSPESLAPLGMSRLREIVPQAKQIAKLGEVDTTDENGAAIKAPALQVFMQECAGMQVRDVIAKVRTFKNGEAAALPGAGGPAQTVAMLNFRYMGGKAEFMRTCLAQALAKLPEAQRNQDNAGFLIYSEWASGQGITVPVFQEAPPAAKKAATKTAAPAPGAAKKAATKQAAPAPAPAPAAKKAATKKAVAK